MENNEFNYTYTAPTQEERREIMNIRNQYIKNNIEESKLDRLHRLNKRVNALPTVMALLLGIVGILTSGLGLSMCLVWEEWLGGIILGILGVVPMVLSFFVYTTLLEKNKAKHREEILALADELLNE